MVITQLIGMLSGGTFGAVTQFISDYLADKRQEKQEKHNRKMAELGFFKEQSKMMLEMEKNVPGLSFTKRVISFAIVLSIVFIGMGLFQSEYGTNVPISRTIETTWFWIFTTTKHYTEYINLKGGVLTAELLSAFLVIISSYFGASIAKRRK